MRVAGEATLEIFHRDDFEVQQKHDASPVTEADLASQRILVQGLQRLDSSIPVIAEESAAAPWPERRSWTRAWLVDPLDGTREFVSGRGEFTLNVALVDGQNGRPLLGAVRAPVLGKSWFGCVDYQGTTGAWQQVGDQDPGLTSIAVSEPNDPVRIVASRSHRSAEVDAFLEHFGPHELVSMGSSLKLCVLAEGGADLYPRLGRTMEWDIAAADAVLRGAGGQIVAPSTEAEGSQPLRYNKEDLANPFFLATASPEIPWGEAWKEAMRR
ncbi:MAG: 3'(2'),5'-bisphosphate nucleotidase CysQ [Thermoanaerobaculia bacterium]|nr:3'(2'),5'-bisphosphate nucleotidase CysQ [Thermoanaerobaculia bacterium]